mmetsp:Transcript_13694/g.25696  ORF Transcript_13694/g.25696 Transcript_13694/m.25696 type:complete len:269 (+) Transcript_13694:495-1301(+)
MMTLGNSFDNHHLYLSLRNLPGVFRFVTNCSLSQVTASSIFHWHFSALVNLGLVRRGLLFVPSRGRFHLLLHRHSSVRVRSGRLHDRRSVRLNSLLYRHLGLTTSSSCCRRLGVVLFLLLILGDAPDAHDHKVRDHRSDDQSAAPVERTAHGVAVVGSVHQKDAPGQRAQHERPERHDDPIDAGAEAAAAKADPQEYQQDEGQKDADGGNDACRIHLTVGPEGDVRDGVVEVDEGAVVRSGTFDGVEAGAVDGVGFGLPAREGNETAG